MPKIGPAVWGPVLWSALFHVAVGDAPRRAKRAAILAIFDALPCRKCRRHIQTFVSQVPLNDMSLTKEGLVTWLYIVKALVSARIAKKKGKTYVPPPFASVRRKWLQTNR